MNGAVAANVLDREVVFNLPRQQVENALLGFSEQAQVQVLTASIAIPDREAHEVAGPDAHTRCVRHHPARDRTGLFNGERRHHRDPSSKRDGRGDFGRAAAGVGPSRLASSETQTRTRLAQLDTPGTSNDTSARPARRAEAEGVEEVVVTATKRGAETAQSLPLSISALSGERLAQAGATEFSDWSHSVPGLVFQDQGPGDKRYIIRGMQSIGAPTVGRVSR